MRVLRCWLAVCSRVQSHHLGGPQRHVPLAGTTGAVFTSTRAASARGRSHSAKAKASATGGSKAAKKTTSPSRGRAPDTPASKKRPSSSSSPPLTPRRTAKLSAEEVEEEDRMRENDTRLAMRLLMSRHLAREVARRKPEERRREAQREAVRATQHDRLQRLEAKTHNSMALLGPGADTVGDGVLPLFVRDEHAALTTSPAPRTTTATAQRPALAWLKPNTVSATSEAAAAATSRTVLSGAGASAWFDEEGEEARVVALAARSDQRAVSLDRLCKPDLSVYDSAYDHRISSAEVLARERELTQLKHDAGIVFEPDHDDHNTNVEADVDDVQTGPRLSGGQRDTVSTGEDEMAQLLRSSQRAEDDDTADIAAADPPLSLYQVSPRTAASMRAQLRAQEEEDGGDVLSLSPYEADAGDDDQWVV